MARELAPELKLELGRLGERGRSGSWGELEGGMAARLLLDKTMRMPERDRNARLGSDGGRRRATGYPGATTDQGPLALTFASACLALHTYLAASTTARCLLLASSMTSFIIKAHEDRPVSPAWKRAASEADCPFCRILRCESPAYKVFENEAVIAILGPTSSSLSSASSMPR